MRHPSGRRQTPVAQPYEEALFRCWNGGLGIGQTIGAIKYNYGLTLSFEEVRQAFIRCCDKFSGGPYD